MNELKMIDVAPFACHFQIVCTLDILYQAYEVTCRLDVSV